MAPKRLSLTPAVIRRIIPVGKIFLALDFDGTLAPIVADPAKARMPKKTKVLLEKLALLPDVEITLVSGRSLKQLRSMAHLRGVSAIGSHGYEIVRRNYHWIHPQAKNFRSKITDLLKSLNPILKDYPGALLEDKGSILAVHYRRLAEAKKQKFLSAIRRKIEKLLKQKKAFLGRGKEVLEIRPPVRWHKGKALLCFRKRFVPRRAKTIYAGDDLTDEKAFASLGKRDVTIFIGPRRFSRARFRLQTTGELYRFLELLYARIRQNRSS